MSERDSFMPTCQISPSDQKKKKSVIHLILSYKGGKASRILNL